MFPTNSNRETKPSAPFKQAGRVAGKIAWKKGVLVLGIPALFLILLGMLLIGILAMALFSSDDTGTQAWGGDISTLGKHEIPAQYIPIYKAAAKEYGVPWNLLAAHHRVETHFSTIHPMVSPVGAEGHMQFMPCTWVGNKYPSCKDKRGKGKIPKKDLINPEVIEENGGYGLDADAIIKENGGYGLDGLNIDEKGKADPYDIEDAIFAAAKLLKKNGAAEGRLRDAVYAYNHADWYVEKVLGFADRYVEHYVAVHGPGEATGVEVVDVGRKWIGNSTYVWGGGRNQADIQAGRFDCSAFVHWAFAQVGVELGRVGMTTTFTLKNMGRAVTPENMKPGDLVFFDTNGVDGHVGIYAGNGRFIGSQSSTGVAFADMSTGYWKKYFNGRVRRILP